MVSAQRSKEYHQHPKQDKGRRRVLKGRKKEVSNEDGLMRDWDIR